MNFGDGIVKPSDEAVEVWVIEDEYHCSVFVPGYGAFSVETKDMKFWEEGCEGVTPKK
jgi:hypothetical protein